MEHPVLAAVELETVHHPTPGVVPESAIGDLHQLMKKPTRQTFALPGQTSLVSCSVRENLMGHPAVFLALLVTVDHPTPGVVMENAKWEEDQLTK